MTHETVDIEFDGLRHRIGVRFLTHVQSEAVTLALNELRQAVEALGVPDWFPMQTSDILDRADVLALIDEALS